MKGYLGRSSEPGETANSSQGHAMEFLFLGPSGIRTGTPKRGPRPRSPISTGPFSAPMRSGASRPAEEDAQQGDPGTDDHAGHRGVERPDAGARDRGAEQGDGGP